MSSSTNYEVMHFKDGHWSIAFITSDQTEALSEAKAAEVGRHVQAVKVVQQMTDEDTGEEHSRTIYSGKGQGHDDEAKKHHPHHGAHKAEAEKEGAGGSSKQELHPEKVTGFIDRLTISVEVFGAVMLVLVILALAYVSNPDAISTFLDNLF